MPFVPDWAGLVEYFETMRGYGIVEAMKDFYWDIRPKPEYGTIEIRVCDTPLTVRRAALLAGYAQSLAAWLLAGSGARRPPRPMRSTPSTASRPAASALMGRMVDAWERRARSIGEDILSTVAEVMPHATRLGCADAVRELADGVRRNYSDAGWLRERLAATGSLPDVVREAGESGPGRARQCIYNRALQSGGA